MDQLSGSSSSELQSWKQLSALSSRLRTISWISIWTCCRYFSSCSMRCFVTVLSVGTCLKMLHLNNRVSRTFQISPDQYPFIYTLELSKNEISGVFPLVPLPSLKEILLNDIALSGTLTLGAGQTAWHRLAVFRFVKCSLYFFSTLLASVLLRAFFTLPWSSLQLLMLGHGLGAVLPGIIYEGV